MGCDGDDIWQQLGQLKCKTCRFVTSEQGLMQAHSCRKPKSDKKPDKPHVKYRSSSNTFTCSLCSFQAEEPVFVQHLQEHLLPSPYKCEACDKRFSTLGTVRKHIQSQHSLGDGNFSLIVSGKTRHILKNAKIRGIDFFDAVSPAVSSPLLSECLSHSVAKNSEHLPSTSSAITYRRWSNESSTAVSSHVNLSLSKTSSSVGGADSCLLTYHNTELNRNPGTTGASHNVSTASSHALKNDISQKLTTEVSSATPSQVTPEPSPQAVTKLCSPVSKSKPPRQTVPISPPAIPVPPPSVIPNPPPQSNPLPATRVTPAPTPQATQHSPPRQTVPISSPQATPKPSSQAIPVPPPLDIPLPPPRVTPNPPLQNISLPPTKVSLAPPPQATQQTPQQKIPNSVSQVKPKLSPRVSPQSHLQNILDAPSQNVSLPPPQIIPKSSQALPISLQAVSRSTSLAASISSRHSLRQTSSLISQQQATVVRGNNRISPQQNINTIPHHIRPPPPLYFSQTSQPRPLLQNRRLSQCNNPLSYHPQQYRGMPSHPSTMLQNGIYSPYSNNQSFHLSNSLPIQQTYPYPNAQFQMQAYQPCAPNYPGFSNPQQGQSFQDPYLPTSTLSVAQPSTLHSKPISNTKENEFQAPYKLMGPSASVTQPSHQLHILKEKENVGFWTPSFPTYPSVSVAQPSVPHHHISNDIGRVGCLSTGPSVSVTQQSALHIATSVSITQPTASPEQRISNEKENVSCSQVQTMKHSYLTQLLKNQVPDTSQCISNVNSNDFPDNHDSTQYKEEKRLDDCTSLFSVVSNTLFCLRCHERFTNVELFYQHVHKDVHALFSSTCCLAGYSRDCTLLQRIIQKLNEKSVGQLKRMEFAINQSSCTKGFEETPVSHVTDVNTIAKVEKVSSENYCGMSSIKEECGNSSSIMSDVSYFDIALRRHSCEVVKDELPDAATITKRSHSLDSSQLIQPQPDLQEVQTYIDSQQLFPESQFPSDVQDSTRPMTEIEFEPLEDDLIAFSRVLNDKMSKEFFICSFENCDFSTHQSCEFLFHVEGAHGNEEKFPCIYCGYLGDKVTDIVHHVAVHKPCKSESYSGSIIVNDCTSDPIPCVHQNLNNFVFSLGRLSKDFEDCCFRCDICKSQFSSVKKLKTHFETSSLKTYSCMRCTSIFLDSKSFDQHFSDMHRGVSKYGRVIVNFLCQFRKDNFESFCTVLKQYIPLGKDNKDNSLPPYSPISEPSNPASPVSEPSSPSRLEIVIDPLLSLSPINNASVVSGSNLSPVSTASNCHAELNTLPTSLSTSESFSPPDGCSKTPISMPSPEPGAQTAIHNRSVISPRLELGLAKVNPSETSDSTISEPNFPLAPSVAQVKPVEGSGSSSSISEPHFPLGPSLAQVNPSDSSGSSSPISEPHFPPAPSLAQVNPSESSGSSSSISEPHFPPAPSVAQANPSENSVSSSSISEPHFPPAPSVARVNPSESPGSSSSISEPHFPPAPSLAQVNPSEGSGSSSSISEPHFPPTPSVAPVNPSENSGSSSSISEPHFPPAPSMAQVNPSENSGSSSSISEPHFPPASSVAQVHPSESSGSSSSISEPHFPPASSVAQVHPSESPGSSSSISEPHFPPAPSMAQVNPSESSGSSSSISEPHFPPAPSVAGVNPSESPGSSSAISEPHFPPAPSLAQVNPSEGSGSSSSISEPHFPPTPSVAQIKPSEGSGSSSSISEPHFPPAPSGGQLGSANALFTADNSIASSVVPAMPDISHSDVVSVISSPIVLESEMDAATAPASIENNVCVMESARYVNSYDGSYLCPETLKKDSHKPLDTSSNACDIDDSSSSHLSSSSTKRPLLVERCDCDATREKKSKCDFPEAPLPEVTDDQHRIFYKCKFCDFQSKWDPETMKVHLRNSKNHLFYKCYYCGNPYFDQRTLKNHIRFHHQNEPFQYTEFGIEHIFYPILESKAVSQRDTKKAKKEVHIFVSNSVTVPKGDERSSGDILSEEPIVPQEILPGHVPLTVSPFHAKKKVTMKKFKCKKCKLDFSSVHTVEKHHKKFHEKDVMQWVDKVTQHTYSASGKLLRGKDISEAPVQRYLCNLCGYRSESRSSVHRHQDGRHANESRKLVVIKLHGFSVFIKDSLNSSSCSSHSEYRLTSPVAGSSNGTARRDPLYYNCHLCSASMSTEFFLRFHLAKHKGFKHTTTLSTQDGLLICAHCSYVAHSNMDLVDHVSSHASDRRYTCSLCDYEGHRRKDVLIHIEKRHKDKSSAEVEDREKKTKAVKLKVVNLSPVVSLKRYRRRRL